MDLSRTSTFHTEPQEASTDGHQVRAETPVSRPPHSGRTEARRKWLRRVVFLLAIVVAIVLTRWYTLRPQEVSLTQATVTTITETIASSGRVRGVTETVVGAQAAGIVETLYVDEGDRVTAGQAARDAEARCGRGTSDTGRAGTQYRPCPAGAGRARPLALRSGSCREQVRQAQAQLAQQRAAVQQAQQSVAQSRAQLHQLQAELNLAATQLERSAALLDRNFISRAEYDQAQTQYRVAEERVAAAQQAIEVAQANVQVSTGRRPGGTGQRQGA